MKYSANFLDIKELLDCFTLANHYVKTLVNLGTFFPILFVLYAVGKLNQKCKNHILLF